MTDKLEKENNKENNSSQSNIDDKNSKQTIIDKKNDAELKDNQSITTSSDEKKQLR